VTFPGLVFRSARRSPVRATLTILAVAITFVAFILLRALSGSWTERVKQTPNDRVVSRHKIGWVPRIPVSYAEEIRRMPGVKTAMGGRFAWFRRPGREKDFFDGFAVEAKPFIDMHDEISAPAAEKRAFIEARQGALVSHELARKLDLRLGAPIVFKLGEKGTLVELVVTGIYESTRHGFSRETVWFHLEYLNELLPADERDTISIVSAQIHEPREGARIAKAIDIHFDTKDNQTATFEDKALNASTVGRFGAILQAFDVVSVLVLGVLVLILGNTIAMGVRERTQEFGVFRAIGFRPAHIKALVVGESAALGLAGGVLGLAAAYPLVELFLSGVFEKSMGFAPLHVYVDVGASVLVVGILLGSLAAVLPAHQASQLDVVSALRHID